MAFNLVGFTTLRARARLVGLVVVLAVVFATASDQYWTAMQTIVNHQDYNVQSDRGRLKVWERGFGYMADRPVLGVGISNFPVAEGTISLLAKQAERGLAVYWTAPHNIFVQVGAELGIPGLLLFIGLFVTMLVSLRRLARYARSTGPPTGDLPRLTQTLIASLIGFIVGACFLSLAYSEVLYTLAAFVVGLYKVARADCAQEVRA